MPSLSASFLSLLHEDYRSYSYFIETGTYNGDTTFAMEPYFKHIYTIELSEKYYRKTKARYSGDKITFLQGDSSEILKRVVPEITEPAIFFLDGHWSSGDTAKGSKDCPLLEEVSIINECCKTNAILIIDDHRLFGTSKATGGSEDWSDISTEKIRDILKDRITDVYYVDSVCAKNDRLIIHIR